MSAYKSDFLNILAERGFIHVTATGSHGGVLAHGDVRRDATLGLAALRLLHAGADEEKTLALRRYILGRAERPTATKARREASRALVFALSFSNKESTERAE